MNCTVLVKKLEPKSITKKIIHKWSKEISSLQSIDARNILKYYGVCFYKGRCELVMEYMSLGSLYDALHYNQTQFEWDERLSIAFQAAIGIDVLHESIVPILHGNIKSSNLLLSKSSKEYVAKWCDFGFTEIRDAIAKEENCDLTPLTTLPYTAPEILRKKSFTESSDIYSLGIIYWELASCKIPYEGKEVNTIREFVLAGDRLKIPNGTPKSFRKVIEKCWAQEPTSRPTSTELVQMIEDCIAEQGN